MANNMSPALVAAQEARKQKKKARDDKKTAARARAAVARAGIGKSVKKPSAATPTPKSTAKKAKREI